MTQLGRMFKLNLALNRAPKALRETPNRFPPPMPLRNADASNTSYRRGCYEGVCQGLAYRYR